MNKIQLSRCPLCESTHITPVMQCFDYFATGEQFDIYDCSECGFRFTQGIPPEAEIGRYYESPAYISHSNTHQGLMNRIYHSVRSYQLYRKAQLVERTTGRKCGTLLDFGTGTGYFANKMAQRGWTVEAIEKNQGAREFAAAHFGLNVMEEHVLGTLQEAKYNAITLWHVMEHIEDLHGLWEQLHRLLVPGGTLVVAVPNCSSYDATYYTHHWAAYDVPRHLWHFIPRTLKELGTRHRFTFSELHPMPFDAFYISMLSEQYRLGRKNNSAECFVRGCFRGLCGWFSSWGRPEKSSSLIYVFKK